MILMAWVFGWLAGAGLPPTATYIIGAVVIVPPMKKLGIDPWVAHFFVFLLSVWGELSPPTSLTAAVSARIANASFLRTMYEALKICAPITLMTFAIFTRFNMVVNPGWLQVADSTLVLISTVGITFAMFGRCHRNPVIDIAVRCLLAAISFVVMFHPDMRMSASVGVVVASQSSSGYTGTSRSRRRTCAIAGSRDRCRAGRRSRPRPGRGQARHRIVLPRLSRADLGSSLARTLAKQSETWNGTRTRLASAGSAPAAWGCPWPSCWSRPATT